MVVNATISPLLPDDLPTLAHLHDAVFGPGRFARTAYRVREGAPELTSACRKLLIDGEVRGAVQMTLIRVGTDDARGMLLGPLVVAKAYENLGYGQDLIAAAVDGAAQLGASYVMLVGDLSYYEKTGFQRVPAGSVALPGPVDANRLLVRMLSEDAPLPRGELRASAR